MIDEPILTLIPDDLKARDAYRLLLSILVPRPIGWISTRGLNGTLNLAPYSFFNGVSGVPPVVMFSAVGSRSGREKDTLRNVKESGEFVVNIVDRPLAGAMNESSGEWLYETNEFERTGVTAAPSTDVKPPRVAEAPISMEARVTQIISVEETSCTMVLGRVLRYHIRRGLLRSAEGLVDASRLDPVARLGGDEYATLSEIFSMPRPKV